MGGGQSVKKSYLDNKKNVSSSPSQVRANEKKETNNQSPTDPGKCTRQELHPSLRNFSGRFESNSSLPVGFNGAVLLDSGTGESKLMHVFEDGEGEVVVTELKILPGLKGVEENPNRDKILQNYEDSVKAALIEKNGAVAIAGFTAWFRALSEPEKDRTRNFFSTRLPDVVVEELRGFEEGMFEAAAVNYAAEKTGLGRPNLQLAAGGGSINMVLEHEPFNIEWGFRKGMTMLMDEGLKAVAYCESEIGVRVAQFKKDFPAAFGKRVEGTVIAISACFYAAKMVGLVRDEAVAVEEITRTFAKRKKELMASAVEVEGKITDKKIAQEISNVVIQSTVFHMLLHPEAKVYFRRDWIIKGTSFRTTWTAGYFIKHFLRKDHELFYPWEESEHHSSAIEGQIPGSSNRIRSKKRGIISSNRRSSLRNHKSFTSFSAIAGDNWGTGLDDGCGTALDDGVVIQELDPAPSS